MKFLLNFSNYLLDIPKILVNIHVEIYKILEANKHYNYEQSDMG